MRADCGEAPSATHGVVSVPLSRRKGEIAEAVRRLDEAGVGIADIAVHKPTLDDAFFTLTGRPAETETDEEAARDQQEVPA